MILSRAKITELKYLDDIFFVQSFFLLYNAKDFFYLTAEHSRFIKYTLYKIR